LLFGSPDATPSGKRSRRSCHDRVDAVGKCFAQTAEALTSMAVFKNCRLVIRAICKGLKSKIFSLNKKSDFYFGAGAAHCLKEVKSPHLLLL
jgi:hypothetical protein